MARFYSENHAHVVCEHVKHRFVTVMNFLAGKDVLELHLVPGKAEKTQMKMTTELLRRLLIGIFLRFKLMHCEGKTLNGDFSRESIFVPRKDLAMAPYMDVKFGNLRFDAFKPFTEKKGNLDLMKVGEIIEHDILSKTELTSELKQLLELLKSDPFSKRSLIYSHISMKGLKEKLSYYMWMYKKLMYLKKKNPTKYANIMQKINNDECWRDRALGNKYLAMLRPFKHEGEQGPGGYSKDGKGKSRFYRNSVEHLPAKFDENNTNLGQESGTQLAPAPQQNTALPATSQSQPAAPLKPEAKRNGTQAEAQRKGVQSAAKRYQLAPNQPAAMTNGTQPAAQVNGAPPAETKGTQQEPVYQVEEEEELQDYHAAIILLDTFPKFLGELQEAMYEESELESCIADGPVTREKHS